MKISLNFKKTLNQNISDIYSKIKKFKKKLNRVNVEIEKTKKKIKIQKEENKKVDERKIFNETLKKINKKKWYENFTYTFTENNLLFVIARNATDNEILIKKHLEKNDLVFHTLSPKSPFGILKEGKKKANETDLNNCAKFISCFSSMWKNNFGTSDVFWVEENQVSKTTKSKEFIEKGSFMIKGKKNIIKNIKLELYFGYEEKELQIEKRKEKYHNFISSSFPYCKKCVKITPGNLKQKELSKKIVKFLKVRKIENLPKYIPQNCYVSSFK